MQRGTVNGWLLLEGCREAIEGFRWIEGARWVARWGSRWH